MEKNPEAPIYRCNPDVVLREEDEDGGLLFNPDTGQVKVINVTGLFIWKHLHEEETINSITHAMREEFDDVHNKDLLDDVKGFIDELVLTGYIGTIVE